MEDASIPPELEISFDPASKTVSELKSILTSYSIDFPQSTQKKSFYIDLFRHEIAAKRIPLLKALDKARKEAGRARRQSNFSNDNPFQSGTPRRQTFAAASKNSPVPSFFVADDLIINSPTSKATKKNPRKSMRFQAPLLDSENELLTNFDPIEPLPHPSLDSPVRPSLHSWTNYSTTPPPQKFTLATAVKRRSIKRSAAYKSNTLSPVLCYTILFAVIALLYAAFISVDAEFCEEDSSKDYSGSNPFGHIFPTCYKCPIGAICKGKEIVECGLDWIYEPPFPSRYFDGSAYIMIKTLVGQVIPFPYGAGRCIRDIAKIRAENKSEAQRRAKLSTLESGLEKVVSRWVGYVLCNHITDADKASIKANYPYVYQGSRIVGMPMKLARNEMQKTLRSWSGEHWSTLLTSISTRSKSNQSSSLYTKLDPSHQHRLLTTPSPELTLLCRLKLKSMELISRNYPLLLSVGLAGILGLFVTIYRQSHAKKMSIVSQLVDDILDMVHDERENYRTDPIRHPIPGLSITQLRDHLLPPLLKNSNDLDDKGRVIWYFSDSTYRADIWSRASKIVLLNSNIRETVMEFQGEQHDWKPHIVTTEKVDAYCRECDIGC